MNKERISGEVLFAVLRSLSGSQYFKNNGWALEGVSINVKRGTPILNILFPLLHLHCSAGYFDSFLMSKFSRSLDSCNRREEE